MIDTCGSDSKCCSCAIPQDTRDQIPAANTLPVGSKPGHGPPEWSAIDFTHSPRRRERLQISGCGKPRLISSCVGLKTRRRASALGHSSALGAQSAANPRPTGSSTCVCRPLITTTMAMICTEPSFSGLGRACLEGFLLITLFSNYAQPPELEEEAHRSTGHKRRRSTMPSAVTGKPPTWFEGNAQANAANLAGASGPAVGRRGQDGSRRI